MFVYPSDVVGPHGSLSRVTAFVSARAARSASVKKGASRAGRPGSWCPAELSCSLDGVFV
jgi:hypothetical protein